MSIKKAKVGFVALVVAASSFVAITSATTAKRSSDKPVVQRRKDRRIPWWSTRWRVC